MLLNPRILRARHTACSSVWLWDNLQQRPHGRQRCCQAAVLLLDAAVATICSGQFRQHVCLALQIASETREAIREQERRSGSNSKVRS